MVTDSISHHVQAELAWDPLSVVGHVTVFKAQAINDHGEVLQHLRVELNYVSPHDRELIKARLSDDHRGIIIEEPCLPAHRRNRDEVELLNSAAQLVKKETKFDDNMFHACPIPGVTK